MDPNYLSIHFKPFGSNLYLFIHCKPFGSNLYFTFISNLLVPNFYLLIHFKVLLSFQTFWFQTIICSFIIYLDLYIKVTPIFWITILDSFIKIYKLLLPCQLFHCLDTFFSTSWTFYIGYQTHFPMSYGL